MYLGIMLNPGGLKPGRFNRKPSRCHSLSVEQHEKLANRIGQPVKLVRTIGLVILKAECMIKTMVKNHC